jgi:hypothetical protein
MAKLEDLKGMTKANAKALRSAGVDGPLTLLKETSTPTGRRTLSKKTKIPEGRLLDWGQRVDLWRITGVDDDYARVLTRSGVSSIVDLSTRNPAALREEVEVMGRGEAKRLPSRRMIAKWIEEARHLVRRVWYHEPYGDPELTGQPTTQWPGPKV